MIDARLLGTWQLDIDKTWHEGRKWRLQARRKRSKYRHAKIRVRITRTKMYFDSAGEKSVEHYRVVAKDVSSVAIVAPRLDDTGEQEIIHIHFEGKYYWNWPEGANCPAYWRRIK